jgi:AraC-like DNA-binding protein
LYYAKALDMCQDSARIILTLNNLGSVELKNGKLDSAFYYLNKSLQISKEHNDIHLHTILNTLASIHQESKQYHLALEYYKLAAIEAKKNNKIEKEADALSNLGSLFFEMNKPDSALYYISLSNVIAEKNNFLRISSENYLTLSKIEKSKGRNKNALEYYEKHATLKDSIFDTEKYGEINQLQRLYEVSKTNQQIEQLVIEKQIRERTIHYQRIIQLITLVVLLFVSVVLLIIFLQKRALNTAYKVLFEKNIEIIDLKENSPKKYKKSTLTDDMQEELLDKILILMEDATIVCDPKFTVDKLAGLTHSNHTYVSQVINTALQKNFRSFLNGFRIREAQRIFSEPEAVKYTIESVALRVGFKSQSAFYDAFKEVTGVSPNFYLKEMRRQEKTVRA